VPRRIAVFGAIATAVTGGVAMGAGAALMAAQDDPGPGRFGANLGMNILTGILETDPYPYLRLPPDEDHDKPWTLALSGQGKRGVQSMVGDLNGQPVDAGGRMITHNGIEMLQVGGRVRIRAAEDPSVLDGFVPSPPEDLGTHTLKGELVDSKCYIGSMRPGRGKAHMGCANLCLIGGIPPGFVTTDADGHDTWFLLADMNGQPLDEMLHDTVSLYVSVTGKVERRDDMLIFAIDQSTIGVL
ncbi:MAG: hypothetical protein AAGC83_03100, partial [Pseudomonadota bacterium]